MAALHLRASFIHLVRTPYSAPSPSTLHPALRETTEIDFIHQHIPLMLPSPFSSPSPPDSPSLPRGSLFPDELNENFHSDVGTYIELRYSRESAAFHRGIPASTLPMPRFPTIGEELARELDGVAAMLVEAFRNRGSFLSPFADRKY